ncbi:MAG: fumarylacetoacetate hydrolase family protein [Rhodoplanes sp.]|uniref:fumarylacetoacetate hydrolase family protein n=1 Tax=Rhodoplanes sp. TaxID=1968906 RepID=UPI00181D7680|nr:fumarylacetoacetate hydrolase family protein [Rhodoplanes sp.]NVO15643.1 fumarylacetoacetate hydrolase family protein [Rhodoplanes sp.]
MRIAAVHSPDGKIFGIITDNEFRPLLKGGAAVRDLRDMITLVDAGADRFEHGDAVALDRVKLAAPVGPLAKNVICVGKNYHDHAQEFARSGVDQSGDKQESPEFPVVFTKATSSLADPLQPVPASADPTDTTDYEGELGVVIGKRCAKVSAEEALDFVFGYTVVNDVTARAVQQRHKQWFLGKSLDGFCPVGPWLVTADEMGPLDGQMLTTVVNGERRQAAPLRDMIFDTPTIIATVSAYVTLEPGDLIATGTPAGVGIGFRPQRFLRPGDLVTVSIEGIGDLTNPIA